MSVVDDRTATVVPAPVTPGASPAPSRLDPHVERPARATLRDQIARLEGLLDAARAVDPAVGTRAAGWDAPVPAGPRVLDLGELERVRDDLAARVDDVRGAVAARAATVAANRARLAALLADPGAHRGVTITAEDVGESACRRWSVRPVLGPVGRLTGWWRVRMSSGCP